MSSTEAPFRATLPIELMGHKILLTAGGDTFSDYQLRWAELAEGAPTLIESFQLIIAALNAAPLTQQQVGTPPPAPAAVVSDGGWATPAPAPQAAPPSAFSAAVAPVCAHGPRNAVSKVGAKGPWKAWMCNAPQGAQKCDPQWVQKNSPEWNTFPG